MKTHNSPRIYGLTILKELRLPIREWTIFNNVAVAKKTDFPNQKYGWTIRTGRTDGNRETGGFYANNLNSQELSAILTQRLEKYSPHEVYIVYPSWCFLLGFNIVKKNESILIEGTYGSQKGISTGEINPEFVIKYDIFKKPNLVNYFKQRKEQIGIKKIINYLDNLTYDSFYTEVALTQEHDVFFFELFLDKLN